MNSVEAKKVMDIVGEMRRDFDLWDRKINAGMQPVAIQDLDYWSKELAKLVVPVAFKEASDRVVSQAEADMLDMERQAEARNQEGLE